MNIKAIAIVYLALAFQVSLAGKGDPHGNGGGSTDLETRVTTLESSVSTLESSLSTLQSTLEAAIPPQIKFVGFSTGTIGVVSSLVEKNEVCRQSFPTTGKARMSNHKEIIQAIDDNTYVQETGKAFIRVSSFGGYSDDSNMAIDSITGQAGGWICPVATINRRHSMFEATNGSGTAINNFTATTCADTTSYPVACSAPQ